MLWRKYLLIAGLYLAQGLPGGLLAYTIPTLLREQGVSLAIISGLSLLALPWSIKLLWSRFLDQAKNPQYYFIASLCFASLFWWLLSLNDLDTWMQESLSTFFVLLLLANLVMASQDVLTDGLVVRLLNEKERGFANSFQVVAYKSGMLIGGALFLASYDALAWQGGMRILVLVLICSYLPYLFLAPRLIANNNKKTTGDKVAEASSEPVAAQSSTEQKRLEKSVNKNNNLLSILKSFYHQPDIKYWLTILVLYKLGDGMISRLVRPFWVDYGASRELIASMSGISIVVGIIAGLVAGGVWQWSAKSNPLKNQQKNMSSEKLLLYFALLQSLSILAYYFLSLSTQPILFLWMAILFEQSVDVMATVILFAAMMSHCRKSTAGVDYTFQATVLLVCSGSLHVLSGRLGDALGYSSVFAIAVLLTIPVILLLALRAKSKTPIQL